MDGLDPLAAKTLRSYRQGATFATVVDAVVFLVSVVLAARRVNAAPLMALLILCGLPFTAALWWVASRMARAAELVTTALPQRMRVLTWTYFITSGRGPPAPRTGAALYPLDHPQPWEPEHVVGAVVLVPLEQARAMAPWSEVEVFGDVRPGGLVALRQDGLVYLPLCTVKTLRWAKHHSFRPPMVARPDPD